MFVGYVVLLLFKRCMITVLMFGNVTLLNEIMKSNAKEAVLNFFLQLIFH